MSQTWAHSAREMDNCACVRTIGSCRQRIGELRKARSVLIGAIELSREIGDELTQFSWYCRFSALALALAPTRVQQRPPVGTNKHAPVWGMRVRKAGCVTQATWTDVAVLHRWELDISISFVSLSIRRHDLGMTVAASGANLDRRATPDQSDDAVSSRRAGIN